MELDSRPGSLTAAGFSTASARKRLQLHQKDWASLCSALPKCSRLSAPQDPPWTGFTAPASSPAPPACGMVLTVSHIVDAIDVFRPLFIIHVLPLAPDNLNRILRKKESAGRAVGTGQNSGQPRLKTQREKPTHQSAPTLSVSGKHKSWQGTVLLLPPVPHSAGEAGKEEKEGVSTWEATWFRYPHQSLESPEKVAAETFGAPPLGCVSLQGWE